MRIITDWKSCKDTLTAKNIKPDEGLIKFLLETSRKKMLSSERLKMDDISAVSKFSLAYDSLRETLEALAVRKEYKIYNHECYTYFLKEVIGESSKGDDFDSVRKVMNGINYYGKDITTDQAQKLIKRINILRNFVLNRLSKVPKEASK
ncbi:MAG: hypothetical protein AABX14_01525 [Candidatus Aenigmatarchaeota archaeon]